MTTHEVAVRVAEQLRLIADDVFIVTSPDPDVELDFCIEGQLFSITITADGNED